MDPKMAAEFVVLGRQKPSKAFQGIAKSVFLGLQTSDTKMMKNGAQNGTQNELPFRIRGVPRHPFFMKKQTPHLEIKMRGPTEPRGSPKGTQLDPKGAQMHPKSTL